MSRTKVQSLNAKSYTPERLAEDFLELSPKVEHAVVVMLYKDGSADVSASGADTATLCLLKEVLQRAVTIDLFGGDL